MDKIILSGVEFFAYGGVSEAEREVGQRYRLHLEMELDLTEASRSDDLEDTVSYTRAFSLVVETARERPFKLIECAAGRIADRLLEALPVDRVTVQLDKLLPPIDGQVAFAGVKMTRERDCQQRISD